MFKNFLSIFFTALILSSSATADRIKDLIDVAGVRSNQVLGFGLVTGLQQTGDGKDLPMTAQALKTLLSGRVLVLMDRLQILILEINWSLLRLRMLKKK